MKKFALGCGGLVVLLLLIVGIGGCSSYNNLVGSSQRVDSSWAQVQNQYQRRADLVPNLVQTVSGAANFEKSTLTDITQARASVGQVKLDPNSAPTIPISCSNSKRCRTSSVPRSPDCWSSRNVTRTSRPTPVFVISRPNLPARKTHCRRTHALQRSGPKLQYFRPPFSNRPHRGDDGLPA